MKRNTQWISMASVIVLAVLTAVPYSAQQASSQNQRDEVALRAAMEKETVQGDLEGAIEQYKKIVDSTKDRSIAAKALVRMAETYGKLNDAGSRRIYERIVKDYSDQKDAVTLALARLGGTNQPTGAVSRTVWTPSVSTGGTPWGTLSRDGRFLSFSLQGDVVLHEIATGVDRKVTNQAVAPGTAEESVISPDGKRIAYIWSAKGEKGYTVQLANLTGDANPRQIYSNPDVYNVFLQDWSPDGQWLALEVHRLDKAVQIALLPVSGGSPRVLKSVSWSNNGDGKAMYGTYFSRDGKYLGYDLAPSNASQERHIYALAIDGSREVPVIAQPGKNEMVGWSPDGKWLLFRSDRTGTVDLWAVAFTDGNPRGMPQRLRGNVGASFHPNGWTQAGALYYQTRSEGVGTSGVQLVSLDFTTGMLLSRPILPTRGYQENTSSPLWSPDGKHLAYLSGLRDRGGDSDELVIRATDTGTILPLRAKMNSISVINSWAPDGRSLFVNGTDLQNRMGIYRVDATTGDVSAVVTEQQLGTRFIGNVVLIPGALLRSTLGGGIYRVDTQSGEMSTLVTGRVNWLVTPNGKTIYYRQAFSATREVALIERDLATGHEKELIKLAGLARNLGQILLSPDGQYVATSSTDVASNSRTLLLIPTAGGSPRELLREPVDVTPEDLGKANVGPWVVASSWAPDSRSLLLRKNFNAPNKRDEIWLASVDGRELSGKIPVPLGVQLSPSPDLRYATYTITEAAPPRTTEISVLENFLPKAAPASK